MNIVWLEDQMRSSLVQAARTRVEGVSLEGQSQIRVDLGERSRNALKKFVTIRVGNVVVI